jgi:hypothetical protein
MVLRMCGGKVPACTIRRSVRRDSLIISRTCRGLMNLTAHLRFVTTPRDVPVQTRGQCFDRCLWVQVPNDQWRAEVDGSQD